MPRKPRSARRRSWAITSPIASACPRPARQLYKDKGIKIKQIFVQHRDNAVTKDQEAIYFFPTGSAEKAVIELTDGSATFSVLVHGLTGRVELRDGELNNVDDHMMRNALGNKGAERDAEGEK